MTSELLDVEGTVKVTPLSNRMHEVLNAIRSFGRPVMFHEVALKLETTSREIEDVVFELRNAGINCVYTASRDGSEWLSPPKGMK